MSDNQTGLSHDMPAPVIKARVYKDGPWWRWEHSCRYRGGVLNYGYPEDSQPVAFARVLKHLEGCW